MHDLSGTGVTNVAVDLEASPVGSATGDGAADTVVVEGTSGVDAITVSGNSSVLVAGLVPTVRIFHPEFANDQLDINTLAGTDTVDSGDLAPGVIQLFVDGVPQ